MPSMTEDLGRVAQGIAASRRERLEAAAERQREVANRHRAVGHQLHEIKTSREKMGRERRRQAAAVLRRRMTETEIMLRRFHRSRRELATIQRLQAVAFMRDLTGRVAALRDTFSVGQQARVKTHRASANAMHQQLVGYRQERHDAGAAWRGLPARPAHRPATERHAAPVGAAHAAPTGIGQAAPAASSSDPAARVGRQRSTTAP
jgi:hypothetical protein